MRRTDPPLAPATFPPLEPLSSETPLSDGTIRRANSRLPEAGELIDRYVVEAWVGDGGVASVYRVRHRTLQTIHALKVLRFVKPELFDRLLAEGRLQAHLIHPNIIRVQDVFEVRDVPALLLDYAEGSTLAERLHEGALSMQEAEAIFRGILAAVIYAHAQGVVHRDLKPGNVMLVKTNKAFVPRVTDFGIARHLFAKERLSLTHSGVLLGTPEYMAPEQHGDTRTADERADLFSLGVILYELCCGRRPFEAPDLRSLLNAAAQAEFVPPKQIRPQLPERLCSAIEACLCPDPEDRVPSAKALLEILDGKAWIARPRHKAENEPKAHLSNETSPTAAKARRWTLALAFALGMMMTAALLQTLRVRAQKAQSIEDKKVLAVQRLHAEAFRRAEEHPGEALALLLAAGAEAMETKAKDTEIASLASVENIYALARKGGDVRVIPAPGQVLLLDVSPDGDLLAGVSGGGTLVLWDLHTGAQRFATDTEVGKQPAAARFTADGKRIIIAPDTETYSLPTPHTPARGFDVATGKLIYTLAHNELTREFTFSRDGRQILTTSTDGKVWAWNATSGSPERNFAVTEGSNPPCLAISPDNAVLAVAQASPIIKTFDLATGNLLRVFDSPFELRACRMTFSPNGTFMAITGGKGSVTLRMADGQVLGKQDHGLHPTFDANAQGTLQISGDRSPTVVVRTLPTLEWVSSVVEHAGIIAARFSPSGRLLTTATNDGRVTTWEATSGRPVLEHRGHRSRILALAQHDSGDDDLLVTGSRDATVRSWSRGESHDGLPPLRRLPSEKSDTYALSPDGTTLVAREADTSIHIRRLDSNASWSVPGPLGVYRDSMAFSPDGRRVLFVATQERAQIEQIELADPPRVQVFAVDGLTTETTVRWLLALNNPHRAFGYAPEVGPVFRLHMFDFSPSGGTGTLKGIKLPGPSYRAAVTPDGRQIVMGSYAGHLSWFDIETAAEVKTHQVFTAGISALRVLPDNQQVLVADWDGHLVRFNITTGAQVDTWLGHRTAIIAMDVSPDGRFVATASWDRTVRIWELGTGVVKAVLEHRGSDPTTLAFSSDGALLVTGSREGAIRVWNTEQGALLAMRHIQTSVTATKFLPRRKEIVALDTDGLAYSWDLAALPTAVNPLELAAKFTNLRVCPGTMDVVPVIPFPSAEQRLAPASACGQPKKP